MLISQHYKRVIILNKIIILFYFYNTYNLSSLPICKKIYLANLKLTIRSIYKIIYREENYQIIVREIYKLIHFVSISRWIEFNINNLRGNNLLTIYYGEKANSIQLNIHDVKMYLLTQN